MGKDIVELRDSNKLSIETIQTLQEENKKLKENVDALEKEKEELQLKIEELIAEQKEKDNKIKELSEKINTISKNLKTNKKSKQSVSNQNGNEDNNTEKIAYLTFDDGPSANTVQILDILKKYNIKATFFVNGRPSMKNIYKRIVEEGHSIGNHTYSHNYKTIYSSVDGFIEDMNKLNDLLKETVGVTPTIIRFPGGSNNTVSKKYGGDDIMKKIARQVIDMGYQYFDWNVSSTDADKITQDKDVIVKAVLEGVKNKTKAVILMHDSAPKTTTVEALPEIIEELIKQGFRFESLKKDSYAPHFLKVN